ncbi:MAG: hypothetical protein WA021_03640 [Minisyncoccia bacterium]
MPSDRTNFQLAYALACVGITAFLCTLFVALTNSASAITVQTQATISICGDGIVSAEEVCDLGAGNNIGIYASSTDERVCAPGCMSYGPYCGDNVLQVRFTEACDDGNNTSGDLCTSQCQTEVATPPGNGGSPTVGATPSIPGATPGEIPSITETKVVIRGRAYPGSSVKVLLDGKAFGDTRADANADFQYTTTEITPGIATFAFIAMDPKGSESILTTVVFEVVQSAVTTVANILMPPTISVNATQIDPGELLTISGYTVPEAIVNTEINSGRRTTLSSDASTGGVWSLQVDTNSLDEGPNTAKSSFELTSAVRSGFGKSVSFLVGEGALGTPGSADINGDDKINLTDFSIFLLSWGTDNIASDFNSDGNVNLADFSIMLFNWTG